MTMMHDARGAAQLYLCDTIVVVSFFSPSESETETSISRLLCPCNSVEYPCLARHCHTAQTRREL